MNRGFTIFFWVACYLLVFDLLVSFAEVFGCGSIVALYCVWFINLAYFVFRSCFLLCLLTWFGFDILL